jgi:hypothetical protein
VVVNVIDIPGIAGLEPKDDTPISADPHGMPASQVAVQRVQPPAGGIHILRLMSSLQRRQNHAQSSRVRWSNPGLRAAPEKRLQSLVAEIPDQGRV